MAEEARMTVAEVVANVLAGEQGDFVHEAVAIVARELMEAEVSAEIGAGRGEVSLERLTHRNGYRQRGWETRVGEIELAIPRKRSGAVRGTTRRSRHLTFLARWPSRQAMGHARQRIREITARSRLRVPVEVIVRDLNRFLRGWAGYFRYGNSARFLDKITLHALRRLAWFIAKRHQRRKRYGWSVVVHQTHRTGLIDLNGTIVAPRPTSRHPGS